MSQFYCMSCGRYRDSRNEDEADYSGEDPICGECVQNNEEQQFQNWAAAIDADNDYIRNECNELNE